MLDKNEKRIAKLAAQLAREDLGRYQPLDRIVHDAGAMVAAFDRIANGARPGAARKAVERMAARYGALLVAREEGLALRFTSGAFSDPTNGHAFYV